MGRARRRGRRARPVRAGGGAGGARGACRGRASGVRAAARRGAAASGRGVAACRARAGGGTEQEQAGERKRRARVACDGKQSLECSPGRSSGYYQTPPTSAATAGTAGRAPREKVLRAEADAAHRHDALGAALVPHNHTQRLGGSFTDIGLTTCAPVTLLTSVRGAASATALTSGRDFARLRGRARTTCAQPYATWARRPRSNSPWQLRRP